MSNTIIERQIAQINQMNLTELREKFANLFGFEPGQTSIPNLRSRLAHRVQEVCIGGVAAEDKSILQKIADNDPLSNLNRRPKNDISKVAGTRYERVWKGKKYEVTVLAEKKFEYNGERYSSLSAIATKITGTHWNGKLFFGVK